MIKKFPVGGGGVTIAGEYTMNALGKGSAGKEIAPAVIVPVDSLAVLEVNEGVIIFPLTAFKKRKVYGSGSG
jgi:hypothetical protein